MDRGSIEQTFISVFCPDCLTKLKSENISKILERKEEFTQIEKSATYAPFVQFKTCYNDSGIVHVVTTTPAHSSSGLYKQELELNGDKIKGSCSCVTGQGCKHVYAVIMNIQDQIKLLRRGSISQSVHHVSRTLLEEDEKLEKQFQENPLTPIEFETQILPKMNDEQMRKLLSYLVVHSPDACKYIQQYKGQEQDNLIFTRPYRVQIEKAFQQFTWFNFNFDVTFSESKFKESFGKLMSVLGEIKDRAASFIMKDPMNAYILYLTLIEEVTEDRFIGNGEEEYLVSTDDHVTFLEEIRDQTEFVESLLKNEQVDQCIEHMSKEMGKPVFTKQQAQPY